MFKTNCMLCYLEAATVMFRTPTLAFVGKLFCWVIKATLCAGIINLIAISKDINHFIAVAAKDM